MTRNEMTSAPLVSVITIFWNAEAFFAEAIESVFAQSYSDWELLLVDDGSTDRSTEIARRYASLYPERVRYLQHADHWNQGMSASRNLGISSARGAFIAFLDADDVWLPNKLDEQVAILSSQPEAAMVYGAIEWWYSWTGKPEDARRDFIPELNVEPDKLADAPSLLTALLKNEGVTTTNGLIRREIIESVGGYEESFRGMYEDQVFYTKICLKAPVFVASKCWYRWRKHPASACAVALTTGEYESARLSFLKWLGEYLFEQGIKDGDIRKTLDEEILKSRHPVLFRQLKHIRYRALVTKESLKSFARLVLPRSIYAGLKALRQEKSHRPQVTGRIKVLVISSAFPPMRAGEADHTFHLCQHLSARGLDVRLLTTRRESGPGAPSFTVHPVIRDWSWRDLPRLALWLKRSSPDVVLLFYIGWIYDYHPMITFAPTISKALVPRAPFITEFANAIGANPERFSSPSRGLRKAVMTWAGKGGSDYRYGTLLRDSDRVIVLSDLHRATLSHHFSDLDQKAVLIPPPPILFIRPEDNGAARREGRAALSVGDTDFLIAYLGYIYAGKGIETLLEAMRLVLGKGDNVRLVVIGGALEGYSAYAEEVYKLAGEMGISDKIRWTGGYAWDSDRASTYLRAADLFVLPIEIGVQMNNSSFAAAAAHGLPIIATRGEDLEKQFIHEENIYLCPPKDSEAMASAIRLLMSAHDLRARLGKGALGLARDWFSWEGVIERTLATFRETLDERNEVEGSTRRPR
jgi:polysaccharide biosynthesis protein PslF